MAAQGGHRRQGWTSGLLGAAQAGAVQATRRPEGVQRMRRPQRRQQLQRVAHTAHYACPIPRKGLVSPPSVSLRQGRTWRHKNKEEKAENITSGRNTNLKRIRIHVARLRATEDLLEGSGGRMRWVEMGWGGGNS